MVMTDPPQHTRYRKLVNTGFTPRMVRRMDEVMRLRTDIILDRICEQGSADFVLDVAAELPLMAIADIIGVPDEDRHRLLDWSNRTIGGSDPEYQDPVDADGSEGDHSSTYETAMVEMAMYAHGLTDQKRAEPEDDLWTVLSSATVTLDDRTGPLLHLAAGGRQRDDPQRHLAGPDGLHGPPRPVGHRGRDTRDDRGGGG